MYFCEYCEIFKNSFFIEHLRWLLLHNELKLCVQWNNILFKQFVQASSCPTLCRKFRGKTLFLTIGLVSQKSKTDPISKTSDLPQNISKKTLSKSNSLEIVEQKVFQRLQ